MDRRNFLRSLIGGVATAAAVRSFPFRVFSFPSEIVVVPDSVLSSGVITMLHLEILREYIPTLMEKDRALYKQIGHMRYLQNADHLTGKLKNLVRVPSQQAKENARP